MNPSIIPTSVRGALLIVLLWLFSPVTAQAEPSRTELVMFELGTCIYCAVWNDAVGRGYYETTLGQRAPLRRVDLRHRRPDDLLHVTGVRMTPTFVLLHGGARSRAYPRLCRQPELLAPVAGPDVAGAGTRREHVPRSARPRDGMNAVG